MGFTPDITEAIPGLLSAREASAQSESDGVLYDVVLSGVGFVFAISSQLPYVRKTVAIQKQQIDTSAEAGEQTLDGNWIRSQTSWHLGAGADFYEPGNRDDAVQPSRFRYSDSRGVDVWTPGTVTLLRKMVAVDSSSLTTAVCGARLPSGDDAWYARLGNSIVRHDSGGTSTHGSAATSLAGGRICPAGSVILAGSATGVYSTPIAGGPLTAIATIASGSVCQPYWVKSRIVISRDNVLHAVPLSGGALGAGTTIYTHPDSAWRWTGVTDTPDAILAAGYSGGVSGIYAFTLTEDSAGTVPKLSQPFQVAELPPGEEIRSIQTYLGRYVGIGTTAGLRIGIVGNGGQVQWGPLLVETAAPVTAFGGRDTFLYAAAGNMVIRADLSQAVDGELRFPYAYDVEIPAGETISSLAFDGVTSRVVVSSDAHGTYAASKTQYVDSGWLESGDVRYGTTAPKSFRALDVEASTPGTTKVAVAAVARGTAVDLLTLAGGKSGLGIGLGMLPSPLPQVRYRITLQGGTETPSLDAVAVKAVPVPLRQRLIQFPLHVVDRPRDSKNSAFGHEGYATELLQVLQNLEDAQALITVVDRTRPEQFEATIEDIQFTRVEPRARGGRPNFGGIALVTVRTL